MRKLTFLSLALFLLVVSCAPAPIVTPTPSPRPSPTPTPTPTTPIPPEVLCHETTPGTEATCRIEVAYCEYRPDVRGQPTFCNSPRPFPNHDFTLLFWRQDRSNLDGQCLIVTGFVSLFRGERQITSDDLISVGAC